MWIGLNVIYEIKNRTFTISFVLVGVIYIFLNKSKELFDKLGESRVMCLATSENNRVTARSMSFILYENKFYFQTDRRFLKHQQIRSNPNVAICYSNIQIEGVCKEMGHHPLLGANDFFACKYKQLEWLY